MVTEKDLVPEGLAVDGRNGSVYLSSLYKRKIVQLDPDGHVADFVTEGRDGLWSTVGLEVDEIRGHLWVVSSQAHEVAPLKNPDSMQWRSAVYCYDLKDRRLVKRVLCADTGIFLNDLAVGSNGDVFVTESNRNRLYRLAAGSDSLERFLTPDSVYFMNGLCFSGDERSLYLGCWNGFLRVDLESKGYRWLTVPPGVKNGGVDGLALYRNSLIAHQTERVVRLYLDETGSAITRGDTLSQGVGFDISTTGEVAKDAYYFIVNSQVQSAYDLSKKTIKPSDSLENIIIRRITLQ
jgi:sugar lactone lactonase YvrE